MPGATKISPALPAEDGPEPTCTLPEAPSADPLKTDTSPDEPRAEDADWMSTAPDATLPLPEITLTEPPVDEVDAPAEIDTSPPSFVLL